MVPTPVNTVGGVIASDTAKVGSTSVCVIVGTVLTYYLRSAVQRLEHPAQSALNCGRNSSIVGSLIREQRERFTVNRLAGNQFPATAQITDMFRIQQLAAKDTLGLHAFKSTRLQQIRVPKVVVATGQYHLRLLKTKRAFCSELTEGF